MGRKKENSRYNIITVRISDEIQEALHARRNNVSVSEFVATALEEHLIRDRQAQFDDLLRGAR